MQKSVLSLAVVAALAAGATASVHAQSNVQVYGLMDAGLEQVTNATPSLASQAKVTSGGKNTSRWGFRGSEDLGGGLKAIFNLEGGVFLDTGNADGPLFKRQAWVGLENEHNRVVIGRSFTTAYDFVILFDPLGYAPNYSWATSSNASGPSKYGMTTAFDNLVKYSGSSGDFKYGASYGFGEQSTGAQDSAKFSGGVTYKAGPVSLLATYEKVNGNTIANGGRDKTTAYHLGAMYSEGAWKVQAVARDYKLDPAATGKPDVRGTIYWGGVSYLTAPAVTLTGVIYYQDVKNVAAGTDADPIMYVARVRYALSKRTDLYVVGAYAKAKNNQLVGLSRDEPGFGNTQRGVMAGIQHRF